MSKPTPLLGFRFYCVSHPLDDYSAVFFHDYRGFQPDCVSHHRLVKSAQRIHTSPGKGLLSLLLHESVPQAAVTVVVWIALMPVSARTSMLLATAFLAAASCLSGRLMSLW